MKARAKIIPRSEMVTDGHRPLGRINVKQEGCETWAADGAYVGKFPTLKAARRALYERDIEAAAVQSA